MNGIHDMGGMHGFGPVLPEVDEPVFHADWEGHVRALMALTIGQGLYNLDEFRFGIERMDPIAYLDASYYERWLETVAYNLVLKRVLSEDDIADRIETLAAQPDFDIVGTASVPAVAWGSTTTESPAARLAPRFTVGDAVITRNTHPTGHTRLPRYARGKRGTIHLVHGPEVFADTNAHARGDEPQVVYNVRFQAGELWGDDAEPGQQVHIDLWESYLAPAPA